MRTAWIVGMAMLYVLLTIVSGVDEQTYFGGTGIETLWSAISTLKTVDFTSISSGLQGILIGLKDLVVGLLEMLTWKFSFFVGALAIIRWVLFAITAGVIMSFAMALRGTSSG